jgi:hypothetical protein
MEILDLHEVRGFTKWGLTQGRGSFDGEPHYASHAWPAMNSSMLIILADQKVEPLIDSFKELDNETEMQGLRAFVWDVTSPM